LQDYVWLKPEEALRLDMEAYTSNFVSKYIERLRDKT